MTSTQPLARLEGYNGPFYTDATNRLADVLVHMPWHDGYGPNMKPYVLMMSAYLGESSLRTDDGYHWSALYCFQTGALRALLAIPRARAYSRAGGYAFSREPCFFIGADTPVEAGNTVVLRLMRLIAEA